MKSIAFVPAVVLAAGGCFATRSDVRILQGDLLAFRQEAARSDSTRARQLATVAATLGIVGDSLREISGRLGRFQGDTRGDLRSVQEQLLQVQELTGQSQRRLQELRASMEERPVQPPVAPPPTVPGDTTGRAAVGPAAPGPNQLYQVSLDQLRRGSYGAARSGFQDFLRLYPTHDLAPEALSWIAEAYAAEGNAPASDSAYSEVVTKYPRAPKAPSALYKLAQSYARQGRRAEAVAAMDRVVREYPASDEASLAKDWLRTNR